MLDHRQAVVRLLLRGARQSRDGGRGRRARAGAQASPLWLVGYFVIVTIGELHLAPVGLALVSRVAPARVLSLMMGAVVRRDLPGRRARRLARRLLEHAWTSRSSS